MPAPVTAPLPDDHRWQIVDRAMQRHDYRPDALIETLHAAPDTFGYLNTAPLTAIAAKLGSRPKDTIIDLMWSLLAESWPDNNLTFIWPFHCSNAGWGQHIRAL